MTTVASVVGVVFCCYAVPCLAGLFVRRRFTNAIAKAHCVCLTFDDGPDPRATPKVLDLLAETGAKATFFMLGENVDKHPELAARVSRAGHEIGAHGYCHKHPWRAAPLSSLSDLRRGLRSVGEFRRPEGLILYRPPYGKLNLAILLYAAFSRATLAFWSVDPRDYAQTSPRAVADYVKARLAPGAVILLHDGRCNGTDDVDATVGALGEILAEAADRGLAAVTVGEALSRAALERGDAR